MELNEVNFPAEPIPDSDMLYLRVHKNNLDSKVSDEKLKIKLIAFDPKPEGSSELSTDWSKYSSALETQNRSKTPSENGVLSFIVNEIRNVPLALEVRHDPMTLKEHFRENRAHSLVLNLPPRKNDLGFRTKLRGISKWEIPIESNL